MRVDTLRGVSVRGDSVTFGYGSGERETAVAEPGLQDRDES